MGQAFKYVAVIGSQRSGTTLTAQMLGAHSRSIVIDEEDGLYTWTSALLKGSDNASELLRAAIKNAQRKYLSPHTRFSPSGVVSPTIQNLVLKAPNLTYSWKKLACAIPDAKIVYVYRNIYAVVASMKKLSSVPIVKNQAQMMSSNDYVAQKFSQEIQLLRCDLTPDHKKMALVGLIKMSFANEFRNAGFDIATIDYETLADEPEQSIKRLLEYINLDYEIQCSDYVLQYQGFGPGLTDRTRTVDDRSVSAWKNQLSNQELTGIEEVTEQFISQHGQVFESSG